MAQIAIPLVIAGVLYLASNEKKECENFDTNKTVEYNGPNDTPAPSKANPNYIEYKNIALSNQPNYSTQKQKEDITVLNNLDRTTLNTNNKGVYSQYQDKYMKPAPKESEFLSLTGEKVNTLNHNNMNVFYNNKSNGIYSQPSFNSMNENRLDNYTGMGTNTIEKTEISSLFKPQENIQNVYGSQNHWLQYGS
jgi:hypothetical protein